MSGNFELLADNRGALRVVLVGANGEVLATTGSFPDKAAAVAGIASVREVAGTGHIIDRTDGVPQLVFVGQQAGPAN